MTGYSVGKKKFQKVGEKIKFSFKTFRQKKKEIEMMGAGLNRSNKIATLENNYPLFLCILF